MKLPQLYLRDLFWLTVVVGLAVGWWSDQARIASRMSELDGQRESANQLMKDVVVAEQRCEEILKEWSELKARNGPTLAAEDQAHPEG